MALTSSAPVASDSSATSLPRSSAGAAGNRLTTTLRHRDLARLRALADREEVTLAELMRRAVRAFIREQEKQAS